MDPYKRNRLIGLIGIGLIVLILAGYFIWAMTADNTRYVEPEFIEPALSAEISDPFDYSTFTLPAGYSKHKDSLNDISLFTSFDPNIILNGLPKKIENIVFSPDGQKAVIFESDKVSSYDIASKAMEEIFGLEGGWGSGVFGEDFYTIGYDEALKKDALKMVNLETGEVEDLVYFIRNVDKYKLDLSEDQTVLMIADQTNIPNVLYLINIEQSTRNNVYESDYIEPGDSSLLDIIAFAAGDNPINTPLKYININSSEVTDFDFSASVLNFTFDNEGGAYFVTDSQYSGGQFYESELDVVTVEDLVSSYAEPKVLGLYKWDGSYEFLMDLSGILPAIPDKIEVNEDGSVIRILVGEEYWDVKVGEY
jgi:hypothetical protein